MTVSNENIYQSIIDLSEKIENGDIKDSYQLVVSTILAVKEIISSTKWNTAQELENLLIFNGKYLIKVAPLELSITNIIYRILHTVKTENALVLDESVSSFKHIILDFINELEIELETCEESIVEQAFEHIFPNEIIMTLGKSKLVEEFLKKASTARSFNVIVPEGAPFFEGHEMANNLAKANIKTTLIPDSSIFAIMTKVDKVIISPYTVLVDGCLRALTGSHAMTHAAKYHSVPVCVLLPLYKLVPLLNEQIDFNKTISPLEGVIDKKNNAELEIFQAYNPVFDYVPNNLVSLFILHNGSHAQPYLHKLNLELYNINEFVLKM